MADSSHSAANTSVLHTGLSIFVADLKDRYARWKLFNETLTELQNLSASDLSDLGISPGNIRAIAYEAAYGE